MQGSLTRFRVFRVWGLGQTVEKSAHMSIVFIETHPLLLQKGTSSDPHPSFFKSTSYHSK